MEEKIYNTQCKIFLMKPWIVRIRKRMQERGMTQESLANELGRGQSWVNHKLSGRRKANIEDIILIADALDISPAALLSNVTNYDKLQDNFLGVSEPQAEYTASRLESLNVKLNQLNEQEQIKVLDQLEQTIDLLIDSKSG